MKPLSSAGTTLLARFARNFQGPARANGTVYAVEGNVRLDHADDRHVTARVRGTLVYKVKIALDGAEVDASCSCPRYNDGHFCKHLWAVLIVATANGHLVGLSEASPIWTHAHDADSDDVLDMDDLPPDGRMPDLAALMSRPPIPKPPPAPSWRDAFRVLREAAVRSSPGRYRAISERVHFVMDAEEIKTTERYILRLFTRTARRDGSRSEPKPLHIWPREIDTLNDPEDRRLVASLFGATAGFHHPYQINQFELTTPLLLDLLPGLCRTGRFHLHVKSGPMWDTPCTWDDTGIFVRFVGLPHFQTRHIRRHIGSQGGQVIDFHASPHPSRNLWSRT